MGNTYKLLPEPIGIKALVDYRYADFKYGLVLLKKYNFVFLQKVIQKL